MTPVKQSKLYCADAIHNGNCYAACLASLLEIPLWMVPPFEDMFGRRDYHGRAEEWLKQVFTKRLVQLDGHQIDRMPEFYIANGRSPRGVKHSTIYSVGRLVHDPHPSGSGIEFVEWTWHLESAK